ncbi:MAG: glycosyltransferase [Polyangiales bacterium]
MISGVDILLFGSLDWGFVWQAPQEIAARLGRGGNRVLYVENTGVRSPHLADARRVGRRLGSWAQKLTGGGVRELSANVYVHSPLVLPPFGSRVQGALNRNVFVPRLKRVARSLGMRPRLFWTFLPTDTALSVMDVFARDLEHIVYYCGGDFAEVAEDGTRIAASEREVARRSDVVFTNCRALAERFSPGHPHVHVAAPGVDLDAFPLEIASRANPPARPVIGYVGTLHKHLDLPLVVSMARARPDWSWVFVGPVVRDIEELKALPNVRIVGAVPHRALREHVREFDVAVVPYARSTYTDTVVPTKINEYLAMGKPVVSTDLPALDDARSIREVITISPASPEPFLAAIERAFASSHDLEAMRRRREVAAESDWSRRLDEMLARIPGLS